MSTPQLARILHSSVGAVMFVSFIIMFFRYWHRNLINRGDIFQARNIRKIVVSEEISDTGHYNFDQKCVFWVAIISLVLLLVSNVIIWHPYFTPASSIPVIRFVLVLHSLAAVALIVVIMVHIHTALWVKGTITVMVEGWVTSAWVKRHHPRWYHEVRKITEKKTE